MPVVDVLLPQFGMGMTDGEIVRWHKAVGDVVAEGEIIADVEAAKANVELPSPASGELIEIVVPEGETVEVRTVIARLRQ